MYLSVCYSQFAPYMSNIPILCSVSLAKKIETWQYESGVILKYTSQNDLVCRQEHNACKVNYFVRYIFFKQDLLNSDDKVFATKNCL